MFIRLSVEVAKNWEKPSLQILPNIFRFSLCGSILKIDFLNCFKYNFLRDYICAKEEENFTIYKKTCVLGACTGDVFVERCHALSLRN